MLSVCYVSNSYMQFCVYFYLVPLLMQCITKLLAYVAALFVGSVSELSWIRDSDARAGNLNLMVLGLIRSQQKKIFFRAFLISFLIYFFRAAFCRFRKYFCSQDRQLQLIGFLLSFSDSR